MSTRDLPDPAAGEMTITGPLRPGRKFRRSAALIAALCIALIAVGDVLFYRQPVGWTIGLFVAVLLAAISLRAHRSMRSWPDRLGLTAIVGLALALVEDPGPLRVTIALLALMSLSSLNRLEWTPSVSAWLSRWVETFLRFFVQLPIDLAVVMRWTRTHGGRAGRTLRTVGKWAIPVLLSAVFVGLFAVANPVIEGWLGDAGDSIGRVLRDVFAVVHFDRVLLWLGVGLLSWTLLRGRSRWMTSRCGMSEGGLGTRSIGAGSPTTDRSAMLVRCLVLFNLVFAVQCVVDLSMWLSNGSMLPDGMSYGVYARRGAYPLVATALLAAVFVLVTFPSGRASEASAQDSNAMRWARRLVYLWIAQNIVLTVSAGFRLELYVRAFSLTRWRVAAAIWMLLVAIGLVTITWRIARHATNTWLVRANAAALLAVLYACCFVHFDAMIAWYDVKHCREAGVPDGPDLDRAYVRTLGPEALLPFRWLESRTADRVLAVALRAEVHALRTELRRDLRTWQGWTRRRSWIAAAAND